MQTRIVVRTVVVCANHRALDPGADEGIDDIERDAVNGLVLVGDGQDRLAL